MDMKNIIENKGGIRLDRSALLKTHNSDDKLHEEDDCSNNN